MKAKQPFFLLSSAQWSNKHIFMHIWDIGYFWWDFSQFLTKTKELSTKVTCNLKKKGIAQPFGRRNIYTNWDHKLLKVGGVFNFGQSQACPTDSSLYAKLVYVF